VSVFTWPRALVLLGALALLPQATGQRPPRLEIPEHVRAQAVSSYSLPVSPTVMASVFSKQDRLLALILWRGGLRWYQPYPHRSYGGGDGKGTISVGLQYGSADVWFSRVPDTDAVTIGKVISKVAPDTNVFLVDAVDKPDGATLVEAFFLDSGDAPLDFTKGTLGPLLRRSPAIVAFLQCEAHAAQQMNRLDVCPEISRVNPKR
jgi:hypothetical protein